MAHLSLVSNLIVAFGGRPLIAFKDKIPKFPYTYPMGLLPEIHPKLDILSKE